MTVTVNPSNGPRLEAKIDVGVHIIKLPPRAEVADTAGSAAEKDVMDAAATLAGAAQPTDIVVFDHQPWHKVNGQLHAHPQVHIDHPETILQISHGLKQRAVWWATEAFRIIAVHAHGTPGAAPLNPFDGQTVPYDARPEPGTSGTVFVVRAQPIILQSIGHVYKITFDIGGEVIDPDMSCNV